MGRGRTYAPLPLSSGFPGFESMQAGSCHSLPGPRQPQTVAACNDAAYELHQYDPFRLWAGAPAVCWPLQAPARPPTCRRARAPGATRLMSSSVTSTPHPTDGQRTLTCRREGGGAPSRTIDCIGIYLGSCINIYQGRPLPTCLPRTVEVWKGVPAPSGLAGPPRFREGLAPAHGSWQG